MRDGKKVVLEGRSSGKELEGEPTIRILYFSLYIYEKKICFLKMKNRNKREVHYWTREMNKQSRTLAALQENLGSVPRNHMVAYNHLEIYFLERYHPLTFLSMEHSCETHTFTEISARIHKTCHRRPQDI